VALAAAPAGAACPGDCNRNGEVVISELVLSVNIALGLQPITRCGETDGNGDQVVSIDELIRAVNAAQTGCPDTPTPTASPPPGIPTPTPTATTTPTPSPHPTPTDTPPPVSTASATPTTDTVSPSPSDTVAVATPTTPSSPTPVDTPTPMEPTPAGGFRDVALSTDASARALLLSIEWLRLLDAAVERSLAIAPCTTGDASETCTIEDNRALRRLSYAACTSTTAGGHTLVIDGTVNERVDDPQFCTRGTLLANTGIVTELQDFRLVEQDGDTILLQLDADLQLTGTVGQMRCGGADADDRVEGTLAIACTSATEAIRCPRRGADAHLDFRGLDRQRVSAGVPCEQFLTVDGLLDVTNTLGGEQYTQRFEELVLSERPSAFVDARELTLNGTLSLDCVGRVGISTQSRLRIDPNDDCPAAGDLALTRPAEGGTAAAANSPPPPLRLSRVPRGTTPAVFRQQLFRAASGAVYQVMQNDDTANGADALLLTTVAGSLGDAVATCDVSSGTSGQPRAVVVVPGGRVFPLADTVRSTVLPHSDAPCFNRNALDGRGRLCIGPACSADCLCPIAGNCDSFTLDDGSPIATAEPPATLVGNLSESCGEGFPSRDTVGFGSGGPTTTLPQCEAPPDDGIELPVGTTLVIAYDSQPLELFNAGAAGFPLDLDGANALCDDAPAILSPGRTVSDTAAAPRVSFVDGAALADYDGDDQSDKRFPGCAISARIACPPATPTTTPPSPTPTVDSERPCKAEGLPSENTLTRMGTTAGQPNDSGEASCGWTGGGSNGREKVYEYVAGTGGLHEVEVTGTDFDPYLYVRDDSCLATQPELGCADDSGDRTRAAVTVELTAGQRVAIVVDAEDDRAGDFTLRVRRQQADLIIEPASVPATAPAGGRLEDVSVGVTNQGDAAAGPFQIEFFYVHPDHPERPVSLAPLVCDVAGLGAGQRSVCTASNSLTVPFVAAGSYRIVARADARNQVAETREDDNLSMVSTAIEPAPGALLEQQVFRAGDGTVYQLLQAVPQLRPTEEGQFRVSTLAISAASVETCEEDGTTAGTSLLAAAASPQILPLAAIRRTGVMRPNNFGVPLFDPAGGGRLQLGAAEGAIEVCGRSERCATEPLAPIGDASPGVPAACLAALPSGSYCTGTAAPETIGFGLAASNGVCTQPAQVMTTSAECNGAATLRNGFDLRPGEAIVFVSTPGRDAVEVGAGALGVTATAAGACGAGQLISAWADEEALDPARFLSLLQSVRGNRLTQLALGPDGHEVYVTAEAQLSVLRRSSATGELEPLQQLFAGVQGVRGVDGGSAVVISADGRHAYVASSERDSLAVFTRDPSGALHFVELEQDGLGGTDALGGATALTLSHTGDHLYVAGAEDNAVAVFARNPDTGELQFVEAERDGVGGADGIAGAAGLALSPDGTNLYVAGADESAVAIFHRDSMSGVLDFTQAIRDVDGIAGANAVSVSADGKHVYVTGEFSNAVVAFERNPQDGGLLFIEAQRAPTPEPMETPTPATGTPTATVTATPTRLSGQGPRDGLFRPQSVAVSPDGRRVYVAASSDDSVTVLDRDSDTGELTIVQVLVNGRDGVDGLDDAQAVAVSPDSRYVYVASGLGKAVTAFALNDDDALEQRQIQLEGLGGGDPLANQRGVTLNRDGTRAYITTSRFDDTAIEVFARGIPAGELRFVGEARCRYDFNIFACTGVDVPFDPAEVAISPDGLNAYAVGRSPGTDDDSIFVYRLGTAQAAPHLDQTLLCRYDLDEERCLETEGLISPGSAVVSPDGRFVYVAATGGLIVLAREQQTGTLTLVEVEREGLPDTTRFAYASNPAIVLSPDTKQAYVARVEFDVDGAILVFDRDPSTGELRFAQALHCQYDFLLNQCLDVAGLEGLIALSASDDGRHMYVASRDGSSLTVFERDPVGGLLAPVETLLCAFDSDLHRCTDIDGLYFAAAIAVAPGGRHVYVGSLGNDDFGSDNRGAVAVFERDADSGRLALIEAQRNLEALQTPIEVVPSQDGRNVYAASSDSVAVFTVNE
jgi:6-phosphogluconolactonase (cycloisomerase 2 family)